MGWKRRVIRYFTRMRVLLVLLVIVVCISLAQSQKRKPKTGPCTVDKCAVCSPSGKKCLTCEEGYTNNKRKTVCFIPTAKIDPDWIEGNAIPAGGGGGDFDKEAFLADIMEEIKRLIAKAKEEAIDKAKEMDEDYSGPDVSGFLKQPAIEALIDNSVNAALEAASDDSDSSGGGGGGIVFDDTQCMRTPMGIEYVGKISETWNGKKCLPWKDVKGVGHPSHRGVSNYDLDWFNFDASWDEVSNHCRTPLNVRPEVINRPPWCWTENPRESMSESTQSPDLVRQRWDYCNIPLCGNPQYRVNWLKTMQNPKYKSFKPW